MNIFQISKSNNPIIQQHNNYYNKCWEQSNTKLITLIKHLINILQQSIISLPITFYPKIFKLNNIKQLIAYTNIDNIDIDILEQINIFLKSNIFVSDDIKVYVENNINMCAKYIFEHLIFYFFYNSNMSKKDIIEITQNIYIISLWIYKLKPMHKIILSYFNVNIKKKINTNSLHKILSHHNVNSGSTIAGEWIMIWRKEELYKVLIHELIHYLDLDIKNDSLINILPHNKIGGNNFPISVNEAITELYAQFLFILYKSTRLQTNIQEAINTIKILYNYELIFSWFQFAKIMNYFSIHKYSDDELKTKFNQTTNVFSYYILKCILTIHFNKIILYFNNTKKTYKISKYINDLLLNLPIDFIDNIIKYFKNNNNNLRMTLYA